MKIQFKKLVWNRRDEQSLHSINNLFRFILIDVGDLCDQRFFVDIYTVSGFDNRIWGDTDAECKQAAQKWFEEQLTQFIETSENPAQ